MISNILCTMRNYCWKIYHKDTFKHWNVYIMMFIIYKHLEWYQHLSFLKSRAPIEHLSMASECIYSSVCLQCSSNNTARQMKGGYYAIDVEWISNQFRRAEGARKRGKEEREGWSVGGKQSEAVSSRVRWLSILSLIGVTRHAGAAGLTSTITPTPTPTN